MRDGEVGRDGERTSHTGRRTVDRRHHGSTGGKHGSDQPVGRVDGLIDSRRVETADIGSRTKGPTCPGDDDDTVCGLFDLLGGGENHVRAQRVELIGTVEDERQNAAVTVDQEVVTHTPLL